MGVGATIPTNEYDERPPDCGGEGCGECYACAREADRRYRERMAAMYSLSPAEVEALRGILED